mmetsp:Transcript_5604/g.13188  ORF Transcript_5604/g.13188 Transcript_5604/m.13188 type:complete len:174 (-) Transcript_5604:157-678(-)
MADQRQEHTTKRRVSFSQDVIFTVDLSYSMKNRQKMYLSPEELQAFLDDLYDEADWARSLGAKELQRCDHLRGLEMLIDDEAVLERRKQKFLGQLAVFAEQDRQFVEEGSVTPNNFDSMAQRYGGITKYSKEEARKRALFYQEMEKVNKDEAELNQRIPMATRPRFSVGPSAA